MSARTVLVLGALAVAATGRAALTAADDDEKALRDQFAAFQAALKARDGAKVLALLDDDSKADAERAARKLAAAYGQADDAGKKKIEEAFGLTGKEVSAPTAAAFLKSKRFFGKYHEVPGSKVDAVEVKGDKAVIRYTEEDGDKEKFNAVKQGGAWKLFVPMPPATP
jgi:hypothetical protein